MKKIICLAIYCLLNNSTYAGDSYSLSYINHTQGITGNSYYTCDINVIADIGDSVSLFALFNNYPDPVGPWVFVPDTANWYNISNWDTIPNTGMTNPLNIIVTQYGHYIVFSGAGSHFAIVANPTSISETNLQNILNISPNPFNDELNISFTVTKPSDLTYEIYDMYGKKIKTYSYHNFTGEFKQSETFENLSAGIYFFQLMLDGERTVKKIVKE